MACEFIEPVDILRDLKLKCIFAKLRGVLGKKSVLEIAHNLVMAELSDISPVVENLQIIFFYVIGTISLVVECTTLFIIVTKGCALTPEFRYLTIFQQVILNFGLFRIYIFEDCLHVFNFFHDASLHSFFLSSIGYIFFICFCLCIYLGFLHLGGG